jgi:NAD(P)-dependent dehydrogenase (short-subunit alcohol dehydrogenase family)
MSRRELSPTWPPAGQRLLGKVCIVTGAGSRGPGIGIGRAIAVLFGRQGAHVILVDKHEDRARVTLDLMGASAATNATIIGADVSSWRECERIVSHALASYGELHILVNNVGIVGPPGSAVEVDLDQWERALRTNLTSMVMMAKYAIPEMSRQGGGAIINISSLAGILNGDSPSLFYPASKGAIIPLTRAMAGQHGAQGIRVNCIVPGLVHTPMVTSRGMSSRTRERRRLSSPMRTEGDAWDVAYGALFLVSDEARWVTGVALPIDGGLALGRLDSVSS